MIINNRKHIDKTSFFKRLDHFFIVLFSYKLVCLFGNKLMPDNPRQSEVKQDKLAKFDVSLPSNGGLLVILSGPGPGRGILPHTPNAPSTAVTEAPRHFGH